MPRRRKLDKPTEEQIAKMVELARDGISCTLIGQRFGLSNTHAARLIREKREADRENANQ